jgi:hypothetical protein
MKSNPKSQRSETSNIKNQAQVRALIFNQAVQVILDNHNVPQIQIYQERIEL